MVFHRKNLAGYLNYFLPVHGKNLRKEKKYNFYQLLTWSQKFLASWQKTGQNCRNIFLRVHWVNLSFEEKWINGISTLISIGYWRKNFRLFVENISANLNKKWIPCVHRNLLSKKVSGEASYFQHFWTLNKKSYPFVKIVKKIVWRSCQNCKLRVRRTILRKKIYCKTVIFSQFWTLSNNFWPFVKVLVEVVKKFQLWVCICGRSWIFKRLSFFFITFWTLREYFSLLLEKLQHGCQNCILFVL